VTAALKAAKKTGLHPKLLISDGGLDANWLYVMGISTVTMETGGKDAHTIKDYVDIPQYLKCVRTALEIATDVD
jgi:tripeptide aminopeptidase